MTYRATRPRLPFSIQWLLEDHGCLDLLLYLNTELPCQLAGLYASVIREVRMIVWVIAKLANRRLVTLVQRMDSADLTFDDTRMTGPNQEPLRPLFPKTSA